MNDLILLEPVFKQVIWGGSRLRTEFGYDIPGDDTGECWAISAHKRGDCTVRGGEFGGMTLSALWETRQDLFGDAAKEIEAREMHEGIRRTPGEMPVFPLLTKIIDAQRDLSVQVHPDDAYAMANENGSLGKTECWYILDCKPGATIVIGHNARTREELQEMIRCGRWDAFIREIPIKKGDFLQIYPGMVHAIKAGTLVLETQQNSDITYRVYDYGRLQNGKPRQLHIEQSIDVITVPFTGSMAREKGDPLACALPEPASARGAGHPARQTAVCEPLVRCEYYRVWKLTVKDTASYRQDHPFLLCSVIEGACDLDGHPLRKGDHFIIPAGYGDFTLTGDATLICSSI